MATCICKRQNNLVLLVSGSLGVISVLRKKTDSSDIKPEQKSDFTKVAKI